MVMLVDARNISFIEGFYRELDVAKVHIYL